MARFTHLKMKDAQRFKTFLAEFEAEGVTDIRVMRERIENEINSRLRKKRLLMTPEERKYSKEQKRLYKKRVKSIKPITKPEPTTDHCPDCGHTDWRMSGEQQSDGSIWWYEGCPACGYIQPIDANSMILDPQL